MSHTIGWRLLLVLVPGIVCAQQTPARTGGYGAAPGFVVESWNVANGLPVNTINQVMQSESGYIWLATFDGLVRFDGVRFSTFNTGNSEGLPSNRIVHIEDASDGALVITTELNQRARFDKGVFSPITPVSTLSPLRPTPVRAPDGQRWEAVGNEITLDGRVVYRSPPGLGNSMSITSIALDREGSLWFGTTAAGLFQLKRALFDVYTIHEGRGDNNLYSVAPASGGGVWAGAWAGSIITRIQDGHVTRYGASNGVPDGVISIFEDSHHRLWLGDMPCALPSVTCRRLPDSPPGIVRAIYEADDGTLWFGTISGLYFVRDGVWSQPAEGDHAPRNAVRGFLRTSDGALWMATNGGGIVRFQNGVYQSLTTREGLPSDLVRALYQDADGWLWVGTEGLGLARLDPRDPITPNKRARIVSIRAKDGLFDDGVHAILEDSSHRLWMSTNRGIFHVARSELNAFADGKIARIRSTGYTERHGLLNREANGGSQPAATRSSDGRLWFATQEGVAVVDPARIRGSAVAPRVVIERVLAGGKPATASNGIEIQPNQRDLEFEYTALSYLAPENIRFRYRLTPYDRDWVDADTRRSAVYTRVPPGKYRFEVTASDGEGARSRVAAATELTVVARFFETTQFKLLVLLGLTLLAWAGVRWRLTRLRELAVNLQTRVDERTSELRQRESLLAEQNTQLEMQADQLQELDRAKSRFFANVSHELRTPLTLAIGPIEDLRAELADTGSRHAVSRLDMALANSRRLLTLVNQILDVAKLEAGSTKLRATRENLAEFVKGVAAAFAGAAESKAIALRIESPIEGVEAWFDHDALEKVVSNLLSNAFKFTPNGGRIVVGVEAIDGGRVARVRVSDSGPGIPPEHLPHIFDRFYQVDETNTRAQPGTGIGLSLARELAELHGGTLDVESGQSGGATFTLSIPVRPRTDDASANAGGRASGTPPIADGDGVTGAAEDVVTLLVVDDNADLRSYVRSRFDTRYRVVEAADGADAIRLARELIPDLVISDVMMPGVDGHALCAALRASADTDFIPVILLTALADQSARIAAIERGADDYIVKPFDMRELDARVENLLASRRLLRERFSGRQVELAPSVNAVSATDDDFIRRVSAAVEANIADPDFGVSELADAVFQERSYLFRRVREVFAETPSDLLRRARLERAKAMLEDGGGSVSEVAYAAGFNSVSHFCRIFRETYSATPSAWREAARKAVRER